MRIRALQIESDQVLAREGGFLGVRRLHLRNVREDGSTSERYICDFLERPKGLDAVVVVCWHRGSDGVHVLLRDGLRPTLSVGRPRERQVIPDERAYLFLTELVAGIVEVDDHGEEGLRRRAAAEVLEEAGYVVDPARIEMLGRGVFPSPGAMAEKFWLTAVEIADPAAQVPLAGDGSPMEEGASVRWLPLADAIDMCVRGEIEDCKTELGLRRLRDRIV
jgi:ADP-ribose pyrophosphatase